MASRAAKRIAALKRILTGEAVVEAAVKLAIGRWYSALKSIIFPGGSTIDLAAWAGADSAWSAAVDELVNPVLGDMFGERFAAIARDAVISDQPHRDRYIAQVDSRLRSFPASVFEQIRPDLQAAIADGQSIDDLTKLLADKLDLDEAGEWRARRIARTEVVAASNGGSFAGAVVRSEVFGETLYKEWLATDDTRTRHTHDVADGQVRRLADTFSVGGFPGQFPGDPELPPQESVNCRCSLVIIDDTELSQDQRGQLSALTAGATMDMPTGWRGVLAPLNTLSGDRRMLAAPSGELRMRKPPIPLMYQATSSDGHDGSTVVGRIDRAWIEGGMVMGEGPFADTPEAQRAATALADGMSNGISVDLDDSVFESRFMDTHGATVDPSSMNEETFFDRLNSGDLREVMVATDWRLAAATMVAIPAFDEARIEPVMDYTVMAEVDQAQGESILASGEPVYAANWFTDPQLDAPTPLTIADDGRVFGHLAQFGVCHVGLADVCTVAPKSRTGYAMFHLGSVRTSDGELPVGKLTVGGGHSDARASAASAAQHYDESGTAVAVVRAGEDAHGIWVAGAILPTATDDQVAELRRSPLSGDWRRVGGNLELVAALAVNVPGFPVPRTLAASGALIASAPIRDVPRETPIDYERVARTVIAMQEREKSNKVRVAAALARAGRDNESRAKAALTRLGR